MKRAIAFISKWWSHLLIALAALAGIWASLHRKRQAAHVAKAREAKRDDLGKAQVEQSRAAASAAKADAILTSQRMKLDRLENHDDSTVAARARAINDRMRRATRTRE